MWKFICQGIFTYHWTSKRLWRAFVGELKINFASLGFGFGFVLFIDKLYVRLKD